jgi:hypothetical protein
MMARDLTDKDKTWLVRTIHEVINADYVPAVRKFVAHEIADRVMKDVEKAVATLVRQHVAEALRDHLASTVMLEVQATMRRAEEEQ